MHIDTLGALATDHQQRIRQEVAQNRTASQAQISRTSTIMEIRQRLGAAFILVGIRLQGAIPARPDASERIHATPAR